MSSTTKKNLRISFGLSVLVLVLTSFVSYFCIRNLLDSYEQVKKTHETQHLLNRLLFYVKDAENNQQDYLLTEENEYLESIINNYNKALADLDAAKKLSIEDESQQQNIVMLKKLIQARVTELKGLGDPKRKSRQVDPSELKASHAYMDRVESVIDDMMHREQTLLVNRTRKQETFALYTPLVIGFAALFAIVISIVFYIRLMKDISMRSALQKRLEEKDKATNERIKVIRNIADSISGGNYNVRVSDLQKDALGGLSEAVNKMSASLSYSFGKIKENEWLQTGMAQLNERMVGEKNVTKLTGQIIHFITAFTGSHAGAIYLWDGYRLKLSNGYSLLSTCNTDIAEGEGIVGQCFASGAEILMEDIDPNYVTISHAIGHIKPKAIIAVPIFFEDKTIGVLELAAIKNYTPNDLNFIKTTSPNIGAAIHGSMNHKRLQELLEETQAQSEELLVQHGELENMNAELEAHTQKLQTSEEELRVQQEELQQSNAELEERNRIISHINTEIKKKADELEQSTRYKSEFMANMSHELRTPLNSILLLSRYLSENSEQNLSDDQKESAQVIYKSGKSLLELIDELLDLSKIEAGKMELDYEKVSISELLATMKGMFAPIAKEKQIVLDIEPNNTGIDELETDKMKLEQILKNLISNALKFTEAGKVTLGLGRWPGRPGTFYFKVTDTGVGIPEDKIGFIFEAFTQADGSTKRKYGGTGLGLSISRHLARLMGGEITAESEKDKGSSFIVTLPMEPSDIVAARPPEPEKHVDPAPLKTRHIADVIPKEIEDDRMDLDPNDKLILIIEDDTAFAKALVKFSHNQNYKAITAVRGDLGIEMALRYKPTAILLDIQLPVMDGWQVMEQLKSNPATKHIPVHIMSSMEVKKESLRFGAVDFINKPMALEQIRQMFDKMEEVLEEGPKKVLIIEENPKHAEALAYYLNTFQVSSVIAHDISDSIESLKNSEVDCIILDMGIPDRSAYQTLDTIKQHSGISDVPIIVFTGKNLSAGEEAKIKQYADSIVVKTAKSYQRILDEVALFLHLVAEDKLPSGTATNGTGTLSEVLNKKKILIADDDVRNLFSLTKALEKHQMTVVTATDGSEALSQLEAQPDIDLVLMDMMMPQMDGYQSTQKIRQDPRFKDVPIIAVTAKAMLGDREKCIAAGASDYISKPVDTDQLISLLRVWLYERKG